MHRISRRRGGYAIEFALSLPVFLSLWMGIIEYCWLSYQLASVNEAVAMGCRTASLIDPGEDELDSSAVINTATMAIGKAYATNGPGCGTGCTITASLVNSRPQRSVQCSMNAPYPSLTGFVPAPSTLTTKAIVRLEYQRGGT